IFYIRLLEKTHKYDKDVKLYLYLLSHIYILPKDQKDIIEGLKEEDIQISENDTRFKNIIKENEIIHNIFKCRFNSSAYNLEKLKKEESSLCSLNIIIKNLSLQADTKKREVLIELEKLVLNNELYKAYLLLCKRREECALGIMETLMIYIIEDYMNMMKTNTIPHITEVNTTDLKVAIMNKDYNKALSITSSYRGTSRTLKLLLNKMILKLETLSNKKDSNIEYNEIYNRIKNIVSRARDTKEIVFLNNLLPKEEAILSDIILLTPGMSYMKKGNKENMFIIKYTKEKDEEYNSFEKYDEILLSYKNNEYLKTINLILSYIEHNINISYGILLYLSMCYVKLGRNEEGIKYLKILQRVAVVDKSGRDFRPLISKLETGKKYLYAVEDISQFDFAEKDIYENYYSFTKHIRSLVFKESINITDACEMLCLNEEMTIVSQLIFIIDLYTLGFNTQADKLLKNIIKLKSKYTTVRNILDDISRNKNHYRETRDLSELKNEKQLTLKI
ncbi:MAG: hypothetical protein RSB41_04295, partial [Bacilli bacterium]